MKIFMYCSLSLALFFLFFSHSSAHITFGGEAQAQFSSSQESHGSSQSQESASSKSQASFASSHSVEGQASSQNQGGSSSSSNSVEGQASSQSNASSQSQGQDASSQSQGQDASSQSQGQDASSQSQEQDAKSKGNNASSRRRGDNAKSKKNDASSKSQGNGDSSKSQGNDASSKSQGNDASSKSQGNDASSKSQGNDASSKSQGNDASSKSQGNDASSKSQGNDASSKSKGNKASRKSKGNNAKSKENDSSSTSQGNDVSSKSQGNDASSQSQGNDASSQSQGNDASSQSQGNEAKSQGNDASGQSQGNGTSSQSQGLNSSFEIHGSFKGSFSKVYAFGGSDTDTGNALLLGGLLNASSPPAGESKGRLGDGRLIVDFLCDALSIPEIAAYKQATVNDTQSGINFAVAGSMALVGSLFSNNNLSNLIWKDSPISFQTQVEWFNNFLLEAGCKGRGTCNADIGNALFWIGEMGVSDFIGAIGSSIPLPHVTEISVRIVSELLKTMLDHGAKYVVVQGLPPIGCLPAYMSASSSKDRDNMGCVASANIGILSYNQILQERLEKFRKLYPHCSILYADYWNAYLNILANAKKYQIEDPFRACCEEKASGIFTINTHSLFGSAHSSTCKDPQNYISWDGIHLTEAMNKKITYLFLNEGFCKPSFSVLVEAKAQVKV